MKKVNDSPEVSRLVGHSLASAAVNKINQEQPNRFLTTTYATPTIKEKNMESKTQDALILETLLMLFQYWMDLL